MKGMLNKPEMLKAIAEGRKTVTRRLTGLEEINQEPNNWRFMFISQGLKGISYLFDSAEKRCYIKPRYRVGEVAYCKEAWAPCIGGTPGPLNPTLYRADDLDFYDKLQWCSPLFMPAWAARTFIQITEVSVERVQAKTRDDVEAEGCSNAINNPLFYPKVWDSINPKYPFSSNPFVWRYAFELVPKQ